MFVEQDLQGILLLQVCNEDPVYHDSLNQTQVLVALLNKNLNQSGD